MSTITVRKGVTFRSVIADCNALWRVERVSGGVAHCVVVNEPWEHNGRTYDGEYAGSRKPFYLDDVERILAYEERFRADREYGEDFFDGLDVGAIVHYNNGFRQFVRCEVVALDETQRTGTGQEYAPGTKLLQPVALCGDGWKQNDLVGEITHEGVRYMTLGYHARKVLTRTGAWRPHHGCVFESPGYSSSYARAGDPTGLPAIDLGVTLTQEQIDQLDGKTLGWVEL